MSYRSVIPRFVCIVESQPLTAFRTDIQASFRRWRVLPALTAADAIAQAELLLRGSPGLKLAEVEPVDEEAIERLREMGPW